MRQIRRSRASANAIVDVIRAAVITKVACYGELSQRFLNESRELDNRFATECRKIARNMATSETE